MSIKPKNKQGGYTLTELLVVLWILVSLSGLVAILFIAAHFIAKVW